MKVTHFATYAFIGTIVILMTGALIVLQVPFALLLGWLPAAARLGQAMEPMMPAISLGLLVWLILFAGTHLFASWCYRQSQATPSTKDPGDASPQAPRSWPLRWTGTLHLGLACVLATGMCVLAVIHQLGWLATTEESFTSNRYTPHLDKSRADNELKSVAHNLRLVMMKSPRNVEGIQETFESIRYYGGDPFWERHQVYFRLDRSTRSPMAIILSRNHTDKAFVVKPKEGVLEYARHHVPGLLRETDEAPFMAVSSGAGRP